MLIVAAFQKGVRTLFTQNKRLKMNMTIRISGVSKII